MSLIELHMMATESERNKPRKFKVVNRDTIEAWIPDYDHHVISIYTPTDKPPKLSECNKRKDVLTLCFSDICTQILEGWIGIEKREDIVLFNVEHANNILEFAKQRSEDSFIIHCDAGISRSPGVAAALSKIYLGDDQFYFKNYLPNSLVYKTILKTHFEK